MSAKTIHDLLPIEPGNSSPNAYEVFGLTLGEPDMGIVSASVADTIHRLRSIKSTTDPQVWKLAAKVVQAARAKLADPKQKAELDAQFGIVPMPSRTTSSSSSPSPVVGPSPTPVKFDPLAGMLPPTNPLAPVQPPVTAPVVPAAAPVLPAPVLPAAAAPVLPAPVQPAPNPATPIPPAPQSAAPPIVTPIVTPIPTSRPDVPLILENQPPRTRRRRSRYSSMILSVFTLGMLVTIGFLVYFLLIGPGTLAITNQNGSLTIKTGLSPATAPAVVARPIETQPRQSQRRFDPVMGSLAGDTPPPSTSLPSVAPEASAASKPIKPPMRKPMPSAVPAPDSMPAPDTMPAPDSMSAPDRTPATKAMPATETSSAPVPMPTPADTPPPEVLADVDADAAIAKVSRAITSSDWDTMRGVAEEVAAMPMSAAKSELAEGLFQLADLATFYRGGIVRGVETLTSGNDFEVTPDLRVVIVETGPDRLVVRANARNKTFTIDQIPFVMAKKLVTFSIDDGPTRDAAMAAFEAVSPLGNDGYRDQAVRVFERIGDQIDDADSDKLILAIQHLFPSTN